MPWWRESDTFADDPVWEVLADGKAALIDALQAAYCRLKSKTAHQLDHGYLTAAKALEVCRGRRSVLALLCTPVLDRKPMLHRQGDECDCLGDSWTDGFGYRIHNFLQGNPTRAEYNRNRAQTADRRDPRLKELVRTRDGLYCRYCRSGPLSPKASRAIDRRKFLQYDHVDPDQPAGPDGENYVVACARCNEFKGHRTPDEADMNLLPAPTPVERGHWDDRGLALFDRPPYIPNQQPINDESPTNHRQTTDPITDTVIDPVTDPDTDRKHDQSNNSTPPMRPEHDQQRTNQQRGEAANPLGSGRVGPPAGAGAGHTTQPTRTAAHPDPYHRRSRASPNPSNLPPIIWPADAQPGRPPPADHKPEGVT